MGGDRVPEPMGGLLTGIGRCLLCGTKLPSKWFGRVSALDSMCIDLA